MDVEEILAKIRAFCEERTRESSVIRKAREKIAGGKATYAEAQKVAMEEGRILEEAFTKYLPEALTNGYLYREFAEKLVKVPVRDQAKEVTKAAEDVQEALNEAAGIGIRPIVPELNREQLDGIVTGICNENFERGKSEFFSQVENFLEGHVDDFVRENADFQYKSGLSPKIERIANAKCCDWCSRMAGIYNYADVSDQGNDVFRRHKNCHCLVTYNPGNGSKRRQDVYTKRWTDDKEELRERKIHFGESQEFEHDYSRIKARKIENYRENNLYIDKNVNISPKEIRRINDQISQAKDLHGITGRCNAKMVIVNDSKTLAAYNPRTDTVFVSSKLGNIQKTIQIQNGFACAGDPRSTMVHELFHWKDAEAYRNNIGEITSASFTSAYSVLQREIALEELKKSGINLSSREAVLSISQYAADKLLDNDFEEIYTELRTKQLIERSAGR